MSRVSFVSAALSVALLFAVGRADAQTVIYRSKARAVPPPALGFTYPSQLQSYNNSPQRGPSGQDSAAARREIGTAVQNLQRQFKQSADYTGAISSARAAQRAYQDASSAILTQVRSSREYKFGQLELSRAEDKLEKARRAGVEQSAMIEPAQQCLSARSALRKIEFDALAGDDSIASAKRAYQDAMAQVRNLVQQFESGIQSDPQWRAARARLDEAQRTRVASAD